MTHSYYITLNKVLNSLIKKIFFIIFLILFNSFLAYLFYSFNNISIYQYLLIFSIKRLIITMFVLIVNYKNITGIKPLIKLILISFLSILVHIFMIFECFSYLFKNLLIYKITDDFNKLATEVRALYADLGFWETINENLVSYQTKLQDGSITNNQLKADISDTVIRLNSHNPRLFLTIKDFVIIKHMSNNYSQDTASFLKGLGNNDPVGFRNRPKFVWKGMGNSRILANELQAAGNSLPDNN